MAGARSKRGTAGIENLEGMLRLRWSHEGKRYCLTLGMSDTRVNRIVAESKAKTIEGNLATGNFDPTRRKYQTQRQQQSDIRIAELLQRFTERKSKRIQGRSLDKFKALKKPLAELALLKE